MTPDEARSLIADSIIGVAPDVGRDEVLTAPMESDVRRRFDLDSMDMIAFAEAIEAATGFDITRSEPRTLGEVIALLAGSG